MQNVLPRPTGATAPRIGPWKTITRRLKRSVVPRTLFGRSLLIVLLPLFILQTALAFIFYERHWRSVTEWLGRGFVGEVASLIELIDEAETVAERQRALTAFRNNLEFVAWFEPGAQIEDGTTESGLLGPNRVDHELLDSLEDALDRPVVLDAKPERNRRIAIHVALDDGVLTVIALRKRIDSTTTTVFMLWMTGLSLCMATVALFLLGKQVRPIRRLAVAADSFGKGRDLGDFRIQGAIEIRRAGTAFNLMRHRILRFIHQRTDMLAGVSHDLRTPLTRMKLALAMRSPDDDLAAELEADVIEMEQMVDSYLAFARGEGRESVAETDVRALLAEIVGKAGRDGKTVTLQPGRHIVMPLRPLAIRRCVTNLLDNAVRHADQVVVALNRAAESIEITIDDDGPGIPEAEREQVFRAFHRARKAEAAGAGLGMTIARDIALSHGGDVDLDTSPLGGLRVTVRLPL